eukprot:jgi/Ulvmu1/4283/UM002_0002.1
MSGNSRPGMARSTAPRTARVTESGNAARICNTSPPPEPAENVPVPGSAPPDGLSDRTRMCQNPVGQVLHDLEVGLHENVVLGVIAGTARRMTRMAEFTEFFTKDVIKKIRDQVKHNQRESSESYQHFFSEGAFVSGHIQTAPGGTPNGHLLPRISTTPTEVLRETEISEMVMALSPSVSAGMAHVGGPPSHLLPSTGHQSEYLANANPFFRDSWGYWSEHAARYATEAAGATHQDTALQSAQARGAARASHTEPTRAPQGGGVLPQPHQGGASARMQAAPAGSSLHMAEKCDPRCTCSPLMVVCGSDAISTEDGWVRSVPRRNPVVFVVHELTCPVDTFSKGDFSELPPVGLTEVQQAEQPPGRMHSAPEPWPNARLTYGDQRLSNVTVAIAGGHASLPAQGGIEPIDPRLQALAPPNAGVGHVAHPVVGTNVQGPDPSGRQSEPYGSANARIAHTATNAAAAGRGLAPSAWSGPSAYPPISGRVAAPVEAGRLCQMGENEAGRKAPRLGGAQADRERQEVPHGAQAAPKATDISSGGAHVGDSPGCSLSLCIRHEVQCESD